MKKQTAQRGSVDPIAICTDLVSITYGQRMESEICSKAKRQEMASKRHNVRVLLFHFLILCPPTALFGQMNTGEITGSVTDPSGAFVPRATVTALEVATQQKHTATSNSAGQYLLPQLPLGEYDLTVEAQGFKQTFQNGVVLHVGNNIRQDISLELGDESQSVTVEATAGLMQVESAEIKDGIENQQIVNCR
jgi:hypothetical protein